MFRQTDGRKVWYEWMVEVFGRAAEEGGGAGGRKKVRLGMSALHSSRKNGCLM